MTNNQLPKTEVIKGQDKFVRFQYAGGAACQNGNDSSATYTMTIEAQCDEEGSSEGNLKILSVD